MALGRQSYWRLPTTRYFVLLSSSRTFDGVCPACEQVMDDGGCRLGSSYGVQATVQRRTGIRGIVEVYCQGVPAHPIHPCPACEHIP